MAGCGKVAGDTTTVTVTRTRTPARSAGSSGSAQPSADAPSALGFARCMRANGAPDFPDPIPGGGFAYHPGPGFNPAAPAVKAAQTKCQRFMIHPPSGPAVGSSAVQSNTQALAQLRGVARCMRQHGIPDFPDPQASPPANISSGEYSNITRYKGAWILFPATINMSSPAWEQAAGACGPLAESFNRPHH